MNSLKPFSRNLQSLLGSDRHAEIPAFLGNLSGTVPADDAGNVYVTLVNGEVLTVYNGKVPNQSRLPVVVGYGGGNRLQVLRSRDVYVTPPYPDVPGHASLHTFPGPDTVPVRGEQIIPGLVVPAGSLTVKVYSLAYELSDGWHVLPTQDVDLTSNVPASGAIFALLEADNTGAIVVTEGSAVASRAMLEYSDIPAATSDHYPVAAVKLYLGQTAILQTVIDSDIIDLRWGHVTSSIALGTVGSALESAAVDTPLDADTFHFWDAVDAILKKITWANIKATLKTYFDTLYSALTHTHAASDITSGTMATARLGSGTANSTTFLRGDNTWATPAGGSSDGWTAYSAVTPTRVASSLDGTFTVTIATPAVFTKTSHGLITGSKIRLTTTGALPTGLAINTDYFVVYLTANTFGLASSLANAVAETPTRINTSGTQSGTHSLVHQTDPLYYMQFAGVDLTTTLYRGMPIKWTQNSIVRYGFIATTPTFSGGNTNIAVLTRCDSTTSDYDVLDTSSFAISSFNYALPKMPGLGFPLSITNWSLSISDGNFNSKVSPVAGTTYNPGNIALMVTAGLWEIISGGRAWTTFPSTPQRSVFAGCSSSQSSFSDSELTFTMVAEGTTVVAQLNHVRAQKDLSTETTYFHLVRTDTASATTIQQGGATGVETYIKAVSAFL